MRRVSPQEPPSVRWLRPRIGGTRPGSRPFWKTLRRFLERAAREGALPLESDDDRGPLTLVWPGGTRISIQGVLGARGGQPVVELPSSGGQPVKKSGGSSAPPAFVPGAPVNGDRCDQEFHQGTHGSRTHVASYPGTAGGAVDLAVHECPSCAARFTDEESAAAAERLIASVVAEVLEEADSSQPPAVARIH